MKNEDMLHYIMRKVVKGQGPTFLGTTDANSYQEAVEYAKEHYTLERGEKFEIEYDLLEQQEDVMKVDE